MATNIPPHNLTEVTRATNALIDDPEMTSDQLADIVLGPDFPTGGTIFRYDRRRNPFTGQWEEVDAIRDMYAHGRGRVVMQAIVAFEETRQGRTAIVATELPYQVNKSALVEKIADLVKAGQARRHQPASRTSPRATACAWSSSARRTRRRARCSTTCSSTRRSSSPSAPTSWRSWTASRRRCRSRRSCSTTSTGAARSSAGAPSSISRRPRDRAHILEGLKIALDNLDEVIRTIRESADVETARHNLMDRFTLSEIQANAILEMQLRRLAALERQKIEDEYIAILKLIAELEDILANPRRVLGIIKDENDELAKKYGGPRRTRIEGSADKELSDEDLIADEDVVITISGRGYIKRQPLVTYRRQARGGKGIIGARTVEEDAVAHLLVANTHDWALFFTDRGRVFSSKVHAIPDASRQAKGVPIINLEGIQVESGERVLAVITLPHFEKGHNLVMATQKGIIKKTPVEQFERVRSTGIRAITVAEDDALAWVEVSSGDDDVVLATALGKIARFHEDEVRPDGPRRRRRHRHPAGPPGRPGRGHERHPAGRWTSWC